MSDTEAKTPEPVEEQQKQEEEPAVAVEVAVEQPQEPEAPAEPETAEKEEEKREEEVEETPAESPPAENKEEESEPAVEEAKGEGEGGESTEQEEKKPDVEVEEEEEEEEIEIKPDGNPHWLSNEEVLAKGVPESEVENFKNFHLKHAYSLQKSYDALKEFAPETEFITLFKEEIEALSKEGDLSEDEQQVLNHLQERINSAIELYNGDGALIKINDRSAKDAILERSEESFVQTVRDDVINSLEVEKQAVCAYALWKDIESQPGMLKRGVNKIRASFRRRGNSASSRRQPKLEEEDKKKEEPKDEAPAAAEEGGETKAAEDDTKPAAEDEATKEDGEAGTKVTVEVEMETEEAAKEEEPEAKEEEPPKEAEPEQPQAEEASSEKPEDEGKKEEEEKKEEEGAGEVQPAEDKEAEPEAPAGDEGKDGEDAKPKRKSTKRKKPEGEHHKHKAAKEEPLDNRVLRAFGRVVGNLYCVKDGEAAVKQLRSSVQIRSCLNSLKPFCALDGVQVSLSVIRWNPQISDNRGMIFRGFVYNNELRAISQYDDTVYFPNVAHYKDSVIRGKIQSFFDNSVKSILTELKDYIMDVFVGPEKIYIIRMNPFVTSVGACLFTWTDNAKELTKGPLQFRVVDTPKMSPDAFSSYQEKWREMLQSVVTQRTAESRATRSGSSCNIL